MSAVDGPLTFATLKAHLPEMDRVAADGTLDLARCTRIDSAGAAYLIESSRRAKARGGSLNIVNANQQVKNLLHFFELDKVVALA
ncbi:STAS domain-containing protein [Hydrocarboniphaga sp.]|uniref:STAS domain-containing protein n=1 Tax=Hydrocarboniphaga sp. TaxID=2033016 RepID=UPI003D0BD8F7